MADILPPPPEDIRGSPSVWKDWYDKVRELINSSVSSVAWSAINFTGSNITSIATRNHNNLQGIQGGSAGEYNHINNANNVKLQNLYTIVSQATDPTITNIPEGTWQIYKNTSSGVTRIWINDAGSLRFLQFT